MSRESNLSHLTLLKSRHESLKLRENVSKDNLSRICTRTTRVQLVSLKNHKSGQTSIVLVLAILQTCFCLCLLQVGH